MQYGQLYGKHPHEVLPLPVGYLLVCCPDIPEQGQEAQQQVDMEPRSSSQNLRVNEVGQPERIKEMAVVPLAVGGQPSKAFQDGDLRNGLNAIINRFKQ